MRESMRESFEEHRKRKKVEAEEDLKKDSKGIIREETIKLMLSEENPAYQSIGIGINSDVFYIGVKLFHEGDYYDAVVCSDKEDLRRLEELERD